MGKIFGLSNRTGCSSTGCTGDSLQIKIHQDSIVARFGISKPIEVILAVKNLSFPKGIHRDETTTRAMLLEIPPFDKVDDPDPQPMFLDSLAYSQFANLQRRIKRPACGGGH